MIIRPDQEKTKIQTLASLAPWRFKNICNSTARCAQDAKHAKKRHLRFQMEKFVKENDVKLLN
jgi:hypothetical protein